MNDDQDAIREMLWDAPASERADLERLVARLQAERPLPAASFRGDLRRRLDAGGPRQRPRRLRALVATYAVMGMALMGTAGLSVLGAGPLAADDSAPAVADVDRGEGR